VLRLLTFALVLTTLCIGQVTTGSLAGSVKDPGGLAVAGATVYAVHEAAGRQVQAATNEQAISSSADWSRALISCASTMFYVQGNRATTNNIAFDGIPATDMGNGSQLKLTVSQDAVAEVRILLSNYQAEYGRMAGSNHRARYHRHAVAQPASGGDGEPGAG
jgi:hypothetical protein